MVFPDPEDAAEAQNSVLDTATAFADHEVLDLPQPLAILVVDCGAFNLIRCDEGCRFVMLDVAVVWPFEGFGLMVHGFLLSRSLLVWECRRALICWALPHLTNGTGKPLFRNALHWTP